MTKGSLARWSVGIAGACAGALLLPQAFDPIHPAGNGPFWGRLMWVSVGWAFIGAGLVAWAKRRESRSGILMVACGWSFWLALLLGSRIPLVWTASYTLQTLLLPLLYYLLLAFPEGRLKSWWDRTLVAAQVVVLLGNGAFALFYDPRAFGCADCPPGLNLLLLRNDFELVAFKEATFGRAGLVLLALLIPTLAARWIRATKPMRRVLNPMIVPALVWAAAFLTYGLFLQFQRVRIYDPPVFVYHVLLVVFGLALIALPVTFLIGFARLRARRSKVSDLVVELGELPTAEKLQSALERALGDPSIEVGVWDPASERYLTPAGDALSVPEDGAGRVATKLERHGEPLAVIVHDPALLEDPGLVAAVTAAARLAVENERLQAEVLEQLAEVHASRARIVEAADEERRRIERNLHDGAQQRLVSLSLALQIAQSEVEQAKPQAKESLQEASHELQRALRELRELARGMYPAVLTDQGLRAAVASLAKGSTIPVEVNIEGLSSERLPEKVEATAYFVIGEALTNVAKYAGASRARVEVKLQDRTLLVKVEDDGIGGADVSAGSGLRGLVDRLEALGGKLELDSRSGHGTRVVATIPCA